MPPCPLHLARDFLSSSPVVLFPLREREHARRAIIRRATQFPARGSGDLGPGPLSWVVSSVLFRAAVLPGA